MRVLEQQKQTQNKSTLYTVAEVARIIKTNTDYVHKLRKSGVLKFLKIGCFKVRKETLDEFLENIEGLDVTDPYNINPL